MVDDATYVNLDRAEVTHRRQRQATTTTTTKATTAMMSSLHRHSALDLVAGGLSPFFSVRAVDSCLTTLVAVWGRCNDAWVAVIGSRDARAFPDRGSRLPDALIFSASRPIKHCCHCTASDCPRCSPRRPGDEVSRPGSSSLRPAMLQLSDATKPWRPLSAFRASEARVSSLHPLPLR